MANLEGKKALTFSLEGSDGKKHAPRGLQGQDGGALLLSKGQYTGLYERGVRVSRLEPNVEKSRHGRPGRE
jgi:hypothetical protein